MNIYIIEGGIGKHVMFSSLIYELSMKSDEKIIIVSGYPDIFQYHPLVYKSVSFDTPGFYDEFIKNTENNIFSFEPYYSNYVKGETHLIEEWCKGYDLEYKNNIPEIYVNDFHMKEAKKFKKENKKFIIVQLCGGQSPLNFEQTPYSKNMIQYKDYSYNLSQKLINKIKEKYNFTILNYSLPNEETYKLENCITIESPYIFYVSLLQFAESFISIDSSLQHFAANSFLKKKGVVLWGATGPKQLGYEKHINISNIKEHLIRPLTRPLGDIFNKDKTYWENPEKNCMDIDPDIIMEALDESLEFNKDIEPDTSNTISEEESYISIDSETQKQLLKLRQKIEVLDKKLNNKIQFFLNKKKAEGDNYVISQDFSKLIKE